MAAFEAFQHNSTAEKANDSDIGSSRAPSPNRGASKNDSDAIEEGYSKADWLVCHNVDQAKRVKLRKLSHMRYQNPDLEQVTTFMRDFGMEVAKKTPSQRWFVGYGPDQYVYYVQEGPAKFLGGAFEVESLEDLHKICQIPAVKVVDCGIRTMSDAPGGGSILTILDPEGFPVNFIFGQDSKVTQVSQPELLQFNYENTKSRARKFQRFTPGPAPIHKLGHFGLCVNDFQTALKFYIQNFNITPSDILYVPSEETSNGKLRRKEVAMFAHIDRGQELVDHHTLFLTTVPQGVEPHVHHCSFEIHDFDTQELGHQWLAQKGYESVWGVGRHILGSQIFDYWYGPDKFMIEHYADGDLVNEDTPLAYGPAGHEGLAVWGPEVPMAFLE